jgi:phosphomannomutase
MGVGRWHDGGVLTRDELVARARAWRDDDPDPVTRAEVDRLLADDRIARLWDRFGATLAFGTAGLRGELGAGPNRMNRAVVIRATAALASWLAGAGHAGAPVVVGYDARHGSATFAADAAAVLAAAGHRVHLTDRPVPTPVVAFGVRHLGCGAGIQITASHNPPRDNGYKVYLADGAQLVSPADRSIAERIDWFGPLAAIARAPVDDPTIERVGDDLIRDYVDAVVGSVPRWCPPARTVDGVVGDLRVVYTPLHGVGREVLVEVLDRAGLPRVDVVAEQAEPDPDFPTVPYPNPEEPGALDLAAGLARRTRANLVLANDPDGDRLAVAVPTGADGALRTLTGDQLGVLLADWLLSLGEGADRLVVTTVVSSSMLGRLAAARGVQCTETLTGFKWIVRPGLERPDLRYVLGYEEALGYCVGDVVRDKDGMSAALAFVDLVAAERSAGRDVLDRLDDLERELGVHVTRQRTVPLTGPDAEGQLAAVLDRLAGDGHRLTLVGRPVTEVEDLRRGERLPPTDGVILRSAADPAVEQLRLVIRPSGTEPKLKCYAEAVVPVAPNADPADGLEPGRAHAREAVAGILDDAVDLATGT